MPTEKTNREERCAQYEASQQACQKFSADNLPHAHADRETSNDESFGLGTHRIREIDDTRKEECEKDDLT
jgi:hypothetical protein